MSVDNDLLTLAQELAEITRLVENDDLETTLSRYVARVVSTVPGCDHATITVDTIAGPDTVTGSGEPLLTYQPGELPRAPSPVLEVLSFREPRRLADTEADDRWPEFAKRMAGAGYRGALALPLSSVTEPSAAFTLFSRQPDQFSDTSYDVVMLFCLQAGVVFDNVSLYHDSRTMIGHLRGALQTRSLIGQAQGLLMHRNSYQQDQAMAALIGASQNHNVKLREVARILVEAQGNRQLDASLAQFSLLPPTEAEPA